MNEVFTVRLSGPATSPVTVRYATVDGTAKAGIAGGFWADYRAASAGAAAVAGPDPSGSGGTVAGGASLHVDSDWGSGLTATVTVSNAGAQAGSAWQVAIDTTDLITNVWNGVILSHQGNTYVIGNTPWNGTTPAGGSTSFGFQASETQGAPLAVHLLGFTT